MKTEQGETPMYLGRVTNVRPNRQVDVAVDDISGREGTLVSLPVMAPFVSLTMSTGSTYVPTHGYHSHSIYGDMLQWDNFQIGDLVLVAQVGLIKEDMIVLGRIYSEFSGGCG